MKALYGASLTPMNDDRTADVPMLADHSGWLLDNGCDGVVLLGTTGESNSFTVQEREQILRAVIDAGLAPSKLIVGTGCCAEGDTVRLTQHALSLGVTRVLMLPPFYYKDLSDEGVYDAYARTFEAVGDAKLRVYLYLIPQLSGVKISADLVERLATSFPQTIAGLKDSSGDWPQIERLCRRLGSKIDVLVGDERHLTQALEAGAAGCVTAIANAAAPLIRSFFDNHDRRRAELERMALDVRAAFESFPLIAALKEFVAARTGDVRWRNLRPPLTRLSRAQADILIDRVSKLLGITYSGA